MKALKRLLRCFARGNLTLRQPHSRALWLARRQGVATAADGSSCANAHEDGYGGNTRIARAASAADANNNPSHFLCVVIPRRTRPNRIVCALVIIVALAGCASTARIDPLLKAAERHPSVPTLYGPHGRLPPDVARTVVRELEKESNDTGLLRTHLTLVDSLSGNAPLVLGNRATLLVDGPATFDAIMKAVRAARHTVNLETYIFSGDKLGNKLANLLIEKQRAGVQVNVIYDSLGSLSTPREFFQRMKDAGINVVEFNPVNPLRARKNWSVNNRDHRKLLVIDGKTVFTGGINLSDVYSSSSFTYRRHRKHLPWRDTEVQITGPVAHYFQKLFFIDWRSQHGPALPRHDYFPDIAIHGTAVARAISSAAGAPNRVYITLISAIRNAQRSVHITAAYFAPDEQLLDALKDTARRGIDVTLILPSFSDFWPVLYTGRSYYRQLLDAGVHIYERHNALLHAKTVVIDGVWSTVGSTNLDWRSLSLNAEINAIIIGRNFGAQMERLFQRDLHDSRRITLAQWRQRPLMERIKEMFGRITARLM